MGLACIACQQRILDGLNALLDSYSCNATQFLDRAFVSGNTFGAVRAAVCNADRLGLVLVQAQGATPVIIRRLISAKNTCAARM